MSISIDPFLGPYLPLQNWYPMPSYLMRRSRVKQFLMNKAPGAVLEVGCGMGTFLHELALQGYECVGYDISENTLAKAKMSYSSEGLHPSFHSKPDNAWIEKFDYLFAFEVLEHIENDLGALTEWLKWLKPGGVCILSVPNHSHKWYPIDEMAGHVRRYDRSDISDLCSKSGLGIDKLEVYGFPLNNITAQVRSQMYSKSLKKDKNAELGLSREELNLKSAQRSNYPWLFKFCKSFIGRFTLEILFLIQRLTKNLNLGNGLVVCARKPKK